MKLISESYSKLNTELHESASGFGSIGVQFADNVRLLCRDNHYKTIVDYGSGKGSLKRALDELKLGLEIQNYDPCVPGDDTLPSQADLVVCFDVLEHVEPDLLENVLAHIRDLARKCVMLSISNIPSSRTLGDGRNAHLII